MPESPGEFYAFIMEGRTTALSLCRFAEEIYYLKERAP